MLARYVQKGDAIDYRPTEAVAAGDVVIIADLIGIARLDIDIIADLIGIARLDIEANTLGSLAVVGVFDVVKAEGAIPSGSTVYWDAGAKKATTVSGSNHYLGKAIAAAEAADAPYSLATTFAAGDPITDLTDNSGGTPSDTIPVLACESGCDCKHAIASLTKKTNTILAALRAVGIIASE